VTTAIIIDPAVQNYAGHHFTAAAGWCEAAQASGLSVRVLAHKECAPDATGAVPIEKIFSGDFYHVAPADQKEARKRLRIMQRESYLGGSFLAFRRLRWIAHERAPVVSTRPSSVAAIHLITGCRTFR
jgi:hypothetical protein